MSSDQIKNEVKNGFVTELHCARFEPGTYMSKLFPFYPEVLANVCGDADFKYFVGVVHASLRKRASGKGTAHIHSYTEAALQRTLMRACGLKYAYYSIRSRFWSKQEIATSSYYSRRKLVASVHVCSFFHSSLHNTTIAVYVHSSNV